MDYRHIYRHVVLPMHCLLRRRSTLRWYDTSLRQQRLSADALTALQQQKLANLVEHSAKHVPYYRELFQQRGIDPHNITDLSTLRAAGIRLDKEDVRSSGKRILSETRPTRRFYAIGTSGSTGTPAVFYRSMDNACRRQAVKFRAEEWIGKPIGTRTTLIWGRMPTRRPHIRLARAAYWWYQNYQFLSAFDMGPDQLVQYIDRIKGFGAEFIESYVTAVHQMARVMLARKIPPPPSVRGILVGAEQLIDEQRGLIEKAFGCKVYNRYGTTEFTNIAHECSHRTGMHINADQLLVEVVDENDQPVVDRVGHIVVTDLESHDMPLIRYHIGDRGVLSSRTCGCGLIFPMLESINGRVSQRVITTGGREVHDMFFIQSLSRIPGVNRFQVIQTALDHVEVNFEFDNSAPREQIAALASERLKSLGDHDVGFAINFVDQIPLTSAGKHRYFISQLNQDRPREPEQVTITTQENRRLRVAHVALQLETGGMEKLLVEFARHADRSRYDLRFISMTDRGDLAGDIEAAGWPVIAMNEPEGLRPGIVLRLMRMFSEWGIDLVHTHNIKPLLYAGSAARLARVPHVIHTCHGQRISPRWHDTLMFVTAAQNADHVVCVSQAISHRCLEEGISSHKVHAIWNGIDLQKFVCRGPADDGPAVMLARLRPAKDVQTLIRAAAIVSQRHPSFRLEIAGDGEQGPYLKQLAADLGLNGHVRFLGMVRDTPALLARTRMVVHSSQSEGVSISLLEAMGCGLPIIAMRVGGNPEVVHDGQTGILLPPGDHVQLADAIGRLWADPGLGHRLGQAGRARVERNFNVRRMVGDYESLYQKCNGPSAIGRVA